MSEAGYQFRSSYCSKDEIRLIGPYVVDEKLIRGAPKYFVQHSSEYGSFWARFKGFSVAASRTQAFHNFMIRSLGVKNMERECLD